MPIDEDEDRFWGLNFVNQIGNADLDTYACALERPYIAAGSDHGHHILLDTADEHPGDPLVYSIDWDDFKYPRATNTRLRLSSVLQTMKRA